MANSSSASSQTSESAKKKSDIRICCNIRGYCEFMESIVPRMRPEHWKAYGSSNFRNYISFGAIPSDKATIKLLIDHLDLATGNFFFKDSQTGNKQAYTFDLGWVQRHTRFKDEGEKPSSNRDTANRIWSTYLNENQRSTYFSKNQLKSCKTGRDHLEALLDKLVDSKKKSVVSDFVMLQILYQLTMIWTPTARMNAPRHMMKYMTGIDVVDHLPWATIIYSELWDSLKAGKMSKNELTYIGGCAPLLSLWYYEITNIKEPAIVNDAKPPMTNWTLEGKKVGSLRHATIMKKSETAIHILPERDLPLYIHEEIKQEPTTMKAKRAKKVEKEEGSQPANPLVRQY